MHTHSYAPITTQASNKTWAEIRNLLKILRGKECQRSSPSRMPMIMTLSRSGWTINHPVACRGNGPAVPPQTMVIAPRSLTLCHVPSFSLYSFLSPFSYSFTLRFASLLSSLPPSLYPPPFFFSFSSLLSLSSHSPFLLSFLFSFPSHSLFLQPLFSHFPPIPIFFSHFPPIPLFSTFPSLISLLLSFSPTFLLSFPSYFPFLTPFPFPSLLPYFTPLLLPLPSSPFPTPSPLPSSLSPF